ncbi:lytic transglycosylase domain-containing protein [Methylomonas sp. AM2-LC]|uniref:lytic transglycosylase domain-containing protein n=1 Tax=Methylomonas sp. AM2-LC TaxID=3153301 RepID=UPI0032669222
MSACTQSTKKDSLALNPYETQNRSGNINTPKKDKVIVSTGIFPKPAVLEPAVEFWRKTYAVWARSQVAFHDDRHLDVIYEVMDLPGNVGEGLTNDQKEMINQRREFWRNQLYGLEYKLKYGAELNANDKQLMAKLQSSGKSVSFFNGAGDRLRSQRGTRERFKRGLEISGRYDNHFRKVFQQAGLPEDLAYLPHVESSFQVSAKSSAGAVGLWQFTKAAAKTFMPGDDNAEWRSDPFISATAAARYLSHAYNKLGDWPSAVTSYNHGIGGMKRAQTQVGNDFGRIVREYDGPAFGFASRNYYAQFLAAREIALDPRQYFKEGISYEMPVNPGQYLASE